MNKENLFQLLVIVINEENSISIAHNSVKYYLKNNIHNHTQIFQNAFLELFFDTIVMMMQFNYDITM